MKLKDLPKGIPDKPGVYFFLGSSRNPLYIGKATSLRDRVRSYFGKDLIETRGPLIVDMVFKSKGLKWQATDSVLEALILEANLIKKHQPFYNKKEKDDKSWNYVGFTKEAYPRLIVVRGKNLETERKNFSAVYGPYTSGSSLQEALKIVRRIFPFLDAKSGVKGRYEFYRQLGLAPETKDRKDYIRNIRNLKIFFAGRKDKVLRSLEKEMKSLAKEHRFEEAGRIRNQIFALKHIRDVALIKTDNQRFTTDNKFRIEAYDVAHTAGKETVGVMVVIEDGEPKKSDYRKFKIRQRIGASDTDSLKELIKRRLGHIEWPLPDLVVIDGGKAQYNAAKSVLDRKGFNIEIASIIKDEKHRPKDYLGKKGTIFANEKAILLANSEAHRFAISYHRNLLRKRI
jgi:excinuclease UvrABC nuclease subunit